MYDKYKVSVPEGQSGDWRVEKFIVDEETAKLEQLRAIMSFTSHGRGVPAGSYTRLVRGGTLVMTDTPDEIMDHLYAIHMAVGRCLVNGLGLGVVVQGMLEKPEVEHVTVVELSQDVIDLVGAHYLSRYGDRLTIVQADALQYKPARGKRFQVVWHDIWDTICADNLPDMCKLHRKYGHKADWQGSWCRYLCERQRDIGW